MLKEIVVQKSTYICDKCKKSEIVETELEKCYGKYEEVVSDLPNSFYELEELDSILCRDCYEKLRIWIGA